MPSGARAVTLPIRTTFDDPSEWPINVRITLDDRLVGQVTLSDPDWRRVELRPPPPGSRRYRRVDIHLDRTRQDWRAGLLGPIEVRY